MATPQPITREVAARELLRRRRARASLVDFALSIDIPGAPVSEDPDEFLFRPVESVVALHHRVTMAEIQRCMEAPRGRLMIFEPPGAAKSTYGSVVGPAWAMGRWPGTQIIQTGYGSDIARKQSRRARQICRSPEYTSIWEDRPELHDKGVEQWTLTNASGFMAAGLLAGITGNRADGAVVDDPVAGREEADSEVMREKTWVAYQDDLRTRLKPAAWLILIMTRWHEDDLAGRILPEKYDGRSGDVRCRDGATWRVLNIPARCERVDDPLGRDLGAYLWPEWVPETHWQAFENDPGASRTWSALFQQRPVAEGDGDFTRAMFHWYDPEDLPHNLVNYGASDFALTKDAGDRTEHGVAGMDERGDLWFHDWYSGQVPTDVGIEEMLALQRRHNCMRWWDEGGVIDKSIRPAINRRMRETRLFANLVSLPSMQDKRAKRQSFRARAAAGTIHLPKGMPWAEDLVDQLVAGTAARFDDKGDVCGLIGRGIDQMNEERPASAAERKKLIPFTQAWIEHDEEEKRGPRYR